MTVVRSALEAVLGPLSTQALTERSWRAVTSFYDCIGAKWRLVHRHAAPITTARSAQSVIGNWPRVE